MGPASWELSDTLSSLTSVGSSAKGIQDWPAPEANTSAVVYSSSQNIWAAKALLTSKGSTTGACFIVKPILEVLSSPPTWGSELALAVTWVWVESGQGRSRSLLCLVGGQAGPQGPGQTGQDSKKARHRLGSPTELSMRTNHFLKVATFGYREQTGGLSTIEREP